MATINELPSGTYRVRYVEHGKRKSKTFRFKYEAEAWIAAHEASSLPPIAKRGGSNIRLDEWAATQMRIRAGHIERTSMTTYLRVLNNTILPRFGNYYLSELNYTEIALWFAEIRDAYSSAWLKQTKSLFSSLMIEAHAEGLIERNPLLRVKIPRVQRTKQIDLFSVTEIRDLANAVPEHLSGTIWVMGLLGLRVGECLALAPSDIDLKRGVLKVAAGMRQEEGRGLVRAQTKTEASERDLVLDPVSASKLQEHFDAGWWLEDRLFRGVRGGQLSPGHYRERFFRPAALQIGRPDASPHTLRHTAVSLWIRDGANPIEVARRAGHTDPGYILKTYGHLYKEESARFAEKFGSTVTAELDALN